MPKKDLTKTKPIEEWDDEELEREQLRNRNGKFEGRPPSVLQSVRKQITAERTRRKLGSARDAFIRNIPDAVKIVYEILYDDSANDKDRLTAAQMLFDRVFGKAMQPIDLRAVVLAGISAPGAPSLAERQPFQDLIDQMLSMDITEPESVIHSQAILGRREEGHQPGAGTAFGAPMADDFGSEDESRHVRVVGENKPNDEADLLRMLHEHPQDPE